MIQIYLLLAGIALLLLFLFFLNARQQNKAIKSASQVQKEAAEKQVSILRAERDQYLNEKITLGNELAETATQNKFLLQKLEGQAEELTRLQEHFRKEFENLANRLLEEKSEKFTRQNQSNIEGLLKPLGEKIRAFEEKVAHTYNQEARERFNLQKELQRMFELNQTLSEQANNLTNALRADTKQQGNWGEYLLDQILETAGFQKDIHYRKQMTLNDEEGTVKRPDVVVFLPEGRRVVVDAKVSLTAYERYFNTDDPAVRQQALREHIRSVKKHVDELYVKCYDKLFDPSPDFVLMFIPVEPAYGLALMEDNRLFEEAFRKRVILVSISSLLATLRIIEAMWRLEKQNRNAAEIVKQAAAMYDKFAGFVEDMQALGQKINSMEKEYDQAMKKLSEGRGSLLRRAETMKGLGLDTKKQLPSGE